MNSHLFLSSSLCHDLQPVPFCVHLQRTQHVTAALAGLLGRMFFAWNVKVTGVSLMS